MGSVLRQQQPMQQWVFSLWSVHGLYSWAATGTVVSWLRRLVKKSVMTSDGKGCHKSWLQQLEPESSGILRVELVTS
jgi:hypothetical protein